MNEENRWATVVPIDGSGDEAIEIAGLMESVWGGQQSVPAWTERLRAEVSRSGSSDGQAFKAVRNGVAVGFARVRRSAADPSIWGFAGLSVHPSHRRRGVAAALLSSCIGYAAAHGGKVIRSDTEANNHASVSFHLSQGLSADGGFEAADGGGKRAFSRDILA